MLGAAVISVATPSQRAASTNTRPSCGAGQRLDAANVLLASQRRQRDEGVRVIERLELHDIDLVALRLQQLAEVGIPPRLRLAVVNLLRLPGSTR